jgi:hypothetical protein
MLEHQTGRDQQSRSTGKAIAPILGDPVKTTPGSEGKFARRGTTTAEHAGGFGLAGSSGCEAACVVRDGLLMIKLESLSLVAEDGSNLLHWRAPSGVPAWPWRK